MDNKSKVFIDESLSLSFPTTFILRPSLYHFFFFFLNKNFTSLSPGFLQNFLLNLRTRRRSTNPVLTTESDYKTISKDNGEWSFGTVFFKK